MYVYACVCMTYIRIHVCLHNSRSNGNNNSNNTHPPEICDKKTKIRRAENKKSQNSAIIN